MNAVQDNIHLNSYQQPMLTGLMDCDTADFCGDLVYICIYVIHCSV